MSIPAFGYEVEFVGGPVDGHVENLPLPPDPFVCVRTINPQQHISFVRRMMARFRWTAALRIPLAIYELSDHDGRFCYRYIASQVVSERDIKSQELLQAVRQRACRLGG